MPFSGPPSLGPDAIEFAALAARHCCLPHPDVVAQFDAAIFPAIRDQRRRMEIDHERGLLLDDNVLARWALFWPHGMGQTHHPRGWTIAHVWAAPKDPDAYTRLANLCLMPECLGSLSDKAGPLGSYLKYHAYAVYGWHLDGETPPAQPEGYERIEWNYLSAYDEPQDFIEGRMGELNNQRVVILRGLMGQVDG
jgi:hypothetical protein